MYFIYLVLFLIFCITLFNLFYKHQVVSLFQTKRNVVSLNSLPFAFNPFDKLFCPVHGFKCPDDTCDCSLYCKGNYEKLNIYENEDIVLFHEKLMPGTYCLPKGALTCHLKSSIPVYSMNNWSCIPRNNNVWKGNHFIACKNPHAENNDLNQLWDRKLGEKASTELADYYEMWNGQLRYECRCESKDMRGNSMLALEEVPFTCVSDYCLSNFKNTLQDIGWKNGECNCGPYQHEKLNDKTSPCLNAVMGMQQHTFNGFLKCTDRQSIEKETLFCSSTMKNNYFTFEKQITFGSYPIYFLKNVV